MRRISNLACLMLVLGVASMVHATTPVAKSGLPAALHAVAGSTDDATSSESSAEEATGTQNQESGSIDVETTPSGNESGSDQQDDDTE